MKAIQGQINDRKTEIGDLKNGSQFPLNDGEDYLTFIILLSSQHYLMPKKIIMKKILIATNIVLLGIVIFQYVNSNNQLVATVPPPLCTDTCFKKMYKPYEAIELPGRVRGYLIKQMSDSYKADLGKSLINTVCLSVPPNPNITAKSGLLPDALSVTFNIEQLKNLIYRMEIAACRFDCDSVQLGIRYYFIKYPCEVGPNRRERDGLEALPASVAGKHSLVMVPAVKVRQPNGTWEWIDYALWSSKKGDCFPKIYISGEDEIFTLDGSFPDPGDNHGGVGPPPNPGTFPTSGG